MQLFLLMSPSLKSDLVLLLLKCVFLKSNELYQCKVIFLPCNVCGQVFVTISKFLLAVKKFCEQFKGTVEGMGLIMLMALRFNN